MKSFFKYVGKRVLAKTPYRILHKKNAIFAKPKAIPRVQPVARPKIFLSLVVPTYNVEKYIDRFLASVFNQSVKIRELEVIIVDDGSTDGSAQIAKDWMARYPEYIRYIHKENGGLSSARNTGLAAARGTWVSFPDPDDFLDVDYFKYMRREAKVAHEKSLLVISSNLIIYHDEIDELSDTHPLRYRFHAVASRRSSSDLRQHIQLSVNSCWLQRSALVRHNMSFDARIVPSFEDGQFINSLMLYEPDGLVSFLSRARYFYRKRADQTSLVDGAKKKVSWYTDQVEFGYRDLLSLAQRLRGSAPAHLQRTCLYDIFWRFRHLIDHPERVDFLTDQQRARFLELLEQVFSYIDVEVIEHFHLAGCTEEHKVALLARYKQQRRSQTAVYLMQMDAAAGMFQFSYFSGAEDVLDLRILVNGREVAPEQPSQRRTTFFEDTWFRQHYFWVPVEEGDEVAFDLDGQICRIRKGGKPVGEQVNWLALRRAIAPAIPENLDEETSRLRAYVLARRAEYRDGIVLMDRPDKADDNAEHLYRHMMATGRATRAWFILSADSPDWARLQAEGFNLLDYGSDEHVAAQMNARILASSHADHNVLWPGSQHDFADLARWKFIFLQHGVTTNDLSGWLNTKPIRMFVTAMQAEYEDISRPDGPYIFSPRETMLSGFPRHDALHARKDTCIQDSILVMPTWRRYLTDESNRVGMRRDKVQGFLESDYARNWLGLLSSPELRAMAQHHGLRIVFAPHPNMAMYLEDMVLPEYIEALDVRAGVSYQDLFLRARLAVTCYSSAATEVAYLQRPLVHFQFDANEMFAGDHVYRRGYFSFERDGFGPVTHEMGEALDRIRDALSGREDPVYAMRRQAAFPFRDGGCCERVCQAIDRLAQPRPTYPLLYASNTTQD